MADHSKPTLTSTYTNFVSEVDGRFDDLALGLDPATTTPTNVPTNAIRWASAAYKWQKWNGTAWSDLSSRFDININGTVGATTPAAGAFTTLTASSTATLNTLASSGATLTGGSINNMAIGGSTAAAASVTTLTTSSTVTLNGGTANGVAYLNGSKVLTTGSALQFDGSNLGLGVTPSAWYTGYSNKAFQFGVGALQSLNVSSSDLRVALLNNAYDDASGNNIYLNTGYATKFQSNGGAFKWFTAPSGTAGNAISFTQALTLHASGGLALGVTTDPGAGNIQLGSGAYVGTGIGTGNTTGSYYGTNEVRFYTSASERARIDSSGNFFVGAAALTSNATYFAFSPGNGFADFGHVNGSASGLEYAKFLYNATKIGSITQNGTTGVLYNLTSDYRLKHNPVALTGAKDFVMALQPKTWDWWDGSGKGVGFIAHEFMEVAKYSGNGEKDAVDADGKPVYQSIQPSSSEVMANLVALIQEQQALITQLQADVAELKGN